MQGKKVTRLLQEIDQNLTEIKSMILNKDMTLNPSNKAILDMLKIKTNELSAIARLVVDK